MSTSSTVADQLSRPADAAAPGASPVHSWDEFTQLREVVVGSAVGARLPSCVDISAWLNLYPELTREEVGAAPGGRVPDRIVDEAEEDLSALQLTLEGLGVKVVRPDPMDHDAEFSTPDWRSQGMYSYCPRDLTLVLGDTLVECPSPTRARYFETQGLRRVFTSYEARGAQWVSAPRPRLADDLYSVDESGRPQLGESEIAFEAANVLRLGKDILYQVSTSGNEAGLRWLERTAHRFGDVRVHPLRGAYGYTHIDSTIAILRPGVVLLNPERIRPEAVPDIFKHWDMVWCPPPVPSSNDPFALSSPWIAMNLLMVTPEIAVVDAAQTELHTVLERRGINVIPHRMRHQATLGGGIHCVTLDIRRDGGLIDYRQ
jgi:glycine amidinotransferase